MSSNIELDIVGTRRILAAIIEQAFVDCGSSDEKERKEALQFFFSGAFSSIALGLKLNERRVRVLAGKEFSKAEKRAEEKRQQKEDEQNTRNRSHKKRKREPAAKKYGLGEIPGELRNDLSEPPTHLR
jgi:hypothetical protein